MPEIPTAEPLLLRTVLTRDGDELLLRAADADAGTFDGYACVWDVTDSYGTTFQRGCFGAGGLDDAPYPLLWMHDPWTVLGLFTAAEDDYGLRIEGRWDDTPEGQSGRAKGRSGSAPGLSVGFVPVMVDPDDDNVFTQARLVESSQITLRMASVPGAGLVGARGQVLTPAQAAAAAAPLPTPGVAAARAAALLALSEDVARPTV